MDLSSCMRRALFTFAFTVAFGSACYAQGSGQDRALAVQAVKKLMLDMAKPGADEGSFYADDMFDIHGSGWIYNKGETVELHRNQAKMPISVKPIKQDTTEQHVIAFSNDLVADTELVTTYYEVPNPQDLARAAGTMTNDPAAMARAKAAQGHAKGNGPAPGETDQSPNPFRSRRTYIWANRNGKWQIVFWNSTRVGLKTLAGHY